MSDKLKVTWSGFTAVDRWTPQRRSMSSTWSEISLEPPCSKKSGVCRFFQRKSGKPRPGGQVVKAKGCLQLDGFRGRSQRQGSGWKLERPHIATSLGRLSDNGCKFQAAIQWLGARVIHIPIYSLLNWELTKENSPAKWQAGDGWLVTELFFNLARLENCQFFFWGGEWPNYHIIFKIYQDLLKQRLPDWRMPPVFELDHDPKKTCCVGVTPWQVTDLFFSHQWHVS